MQRSLSLLFSAAVLAAAAATATAQSQPAPIQRSYPGQRASTPQVSTARPIPGVIVRTDPASAVQTVSATDDVTELRITAGRANVSVRHPEHNTQLLVDLPGGQTALLKDGLYTFNASTNTVRVLKGEAKVFPGTTNNAIKVKEDHQFTFGSSARPTEVSFNQARTDLLQGPISGYGAGYYGDGPYYPYAYGGYPYYPYGYYGYPYGYPYGFGIGFGYFGGFRGGFGGFHHFR